MAHVPGRKSNGVVVSICIKRKEGSFGYGYDPGIVFAGTDRKYVVERALALATPDQAALLRLKLGPFIEGQIDQGRADVISEGTSYNTESGVSLFYDACEVVL